MPTYRCSWDLRRNGARHQPGALVALTTAVAAQIGTGPGRVLQYESDDPTDEALGALQGVVQAPPVPAPQAAPEGAPAPAHVAPGGGARLAAIQAAIRQLDPQDPNEYTQAGLPRVDAIERVLGGEITAEERDAALQGPEG